MNTDDFEQKLQRQIPRQIPAEWRADILNAASQQPRGTQNPASWSALGWPTLLWRELVWPSRRIWAGIAAAWVLIGVVNLHDLRHTELARHDFTPPSPALLMALREPERWLHDFVEPQKVPEADRPKKGPPMPRSEGRNRFLQT